MTLFLKISGTSDVDSFRHAEDFLHSLTERTPVPTFSTDEKQRRDFGAVEVVTWVLAVPGAIAALVELQRQIRSLPKRKELRQRIEPTLTRLKDQPSLELDIAGQKINLGQATIDDVLDALAKAEIETDQNGSSR